MNYEQIEDDIVTHLQPLTEAVGPAPEQQGYSVIPMPETEKEVSGSDGKALFKPRITVMYKGSDYEKQETQRRILKSPGMIIQQEFVIVDILVQATKLRGEAGLYRMLQLCKFLLVGFAPTDCQKMYLTEGGFNEYNKEKGVWSRFLTFYCETTVVDAQTEEEILGVIKDIRLDNSGPIEENMTVQAPDAPVIEVEEVDSDSIKFKWPVVEGAQGYVFDLARTDDFSDLVFTNIDLHSAVEFEAAGLASGTNYFARARAYNHESVSVNSNVIQQATT